MAHKIAFLYGFGEGTWHSKQFKKRLHSTEFDIIPDITTADIVIAHSAGSFYVPKLQGHQLLVLIGPTYWPGKNVIVQMIQKIAIDIRLNGFRHPLYLLQKTAWNMFYIVGSLRRSREIISLGKTFNLPSAIKHHRTIIIRNDADTWLTPDLEALQQRQPSLRIHHVPGDHDDCWLHPDIYIHLIQSDI